MKAFFKEAAEIIIVICMLPAIMIAYSDKIIVKIIGVILSPLMLIGIGLERITRSTNEPGENK